MSARSNLVINDRASTPVAHTYTPDGEPGKAGVHQFSEKTSVPAGNPTYTISLQQPNGTGRYYRATVKLVIPVVQTQTINGITSPVVVRTSTIHFDTQFDKLSTDQERKDAVGLMVNSLAAAQTQINDLVVNLSDIY